MKTAKPFLKWVGGKTQLLYQFEQLYPKEYNNYFEPFLGGGAVFFSIKPNKKAYLNDNNKTLISAYNYIKNKPDRIIAELKKIQKEYNKKNDLEKENFYYLIRDRFNDLSNENIKKSAYLIFINKTCFNGTYRENSNGHFNVPFGRYKNPKIIDQENLLAVSRILKNAVISSEDFEKAIKKVKKGDFVYFDPPYHPLNSTSRFTKYLDSDFLKKEQFRLKNTVDVLNKKGAFVMLSNSYTDFICKLYKNYKQITVTANRMINCKSKGRGKIKELVIINY